VTSSWTGNFPLLLLLPDGMIFRLELRLETGACKILNPTIQWENDEKSGKVEKWESVYRFLHRLLPEQQIFPSREEDESAIPCPTTHHKQKTRTHKSDRLHRRRLSK
jgi:hypothetical protein